MLVAALVWAHKYRSANVSKDSSNESLVLKILNTFQNET